MPYNFEPYEKFRKSFLGVSVNRNNLYISNPLMEKMEGVRHAAVLFDKKSKAILVTPVRANNARAYQITKYGKSKLGGSRIGVKLMDSGMPDGRYIFKESTDRGIICVQ